MIIPPINSFLDICVTPKTMDAPRGFFRFSRSSCPKTAIGVNDKIPANQSKRVGRSCAAGCRRKQAFEPRPRGAQADITG